MESKLCIDDSVSDNALMQAVRDNKDRKAFRLLVRRHMGTMIGVAYRMGINSQHADDIVQESFLSIWQKAHTWSEKDNASLKSWFTKITYNKCIDHQRKIKKDHNRQDIDMNILAGSMNVEQAVERKQTMRFIMDALKNLPKRQRAALILCHYQGFTQKETAQIIGTSVKGVEGLLIRARRNMKKSLNTYKDSSGILGERA